MGAEQMDVGKHTAVWIGVMAFLTALGGIFLAVGYGCWWWQVPGIVLLGFAGYILLGFFISWLPLPPLRDQKNPRPRQAVAAPSFLDLAAPDAKEKKAYGVAQEEDGTPRIGYETFGRSGEQKIKFGSDLRPLAVRVFEPLKLNIRAKDLPVTIRSPEHDGLPILTVNRFVNGGIWIEEESRGVVVRFRVYFGDDDWTPPYSESQLP